MMRIKNTILTAIAAGIAFLGGIMMLGKNPFRKKEKVKKDYVDMPKSLKESTLEEEMNIKQRYEQLDKKLNKQEEEEKVLEMLRMVILDAQKEKVAKYKSVVERPYRIKRVDKEYIAHRRIVTQNQKQLHNIREPSAKNQIQSVHCKTANFKIYEKNKGGDKGG